MLTERLIDLMDKGDREAFGRATSVFGITCNVVLVLAKGIGGLAAGSISMVADAANNLLDAASNVISLIGFKLASLPADAEHPYGHGRFEYLAGLAISVLIIVTGIELTQSSVARILQPSPTRFAPIAIVLLVASIALKLWMAWFYDMAGRRIESSALRAASKDSQNDAIATAAVLAGALVTRFASLNVDGWLGAAVGLFVTASGIGLMRDTVDPLLGGMPDPRLVERIRTRILSHPEVLGTHDLMIHDYGPGHRFASAHVEMAAEEDPVDSHAVIDQIEKELRRDEGLVSVLHYDPIVTRMPPGDLRMLVDDATKNVDARLTIHDLVVQVEEGRSKIAFDCLVPPSVKTDTTSLEQNITREVQARIPHATCDITFDTGYVSAQQ